MFFVLMSFEEKQKCLSLLANIAKVDGNFHEKESQLISGYRALMGLPEQALEEHTTEALLSYFSSKSELVRKSVFLEAQGLILADKIYHAEEETLVGKIREAFQLTHEYVEESRAWAKSMLPLYYKGFELAGVTASA